LACECRFSLPFVRLRAGGSPSTSSGTAVLYYLIVFDFCARRAQNRKQKNENTMLPSILRLP